MRTAKILWLKFRGQFFLLLSVWMVGVIGYSIIEQWSFFESLYMTVITITTVGFSEVHQLSLGGRIFTIFLVGSGVTAGAYAVGNIASFLTGGEARRIFMEGMLDKRLSKLKDHIILLGFGKFGWEVSQEVSRKKTPLIIIEKNEERVRTAADMGYRVLKGSGTDEHLLEKVGVKRAKGLVAAMSDEADNVFAVLTARVLNPGLTIVSRGEEEESEKKLRRAGANRVILPYQIGGRRMAAVVMQPAILDFLDVIFCGDELALELMEVHLVKDSSLVGKTLNDSDIRAKTGGALILGVKSASGELTANPDRFTILHPEDILIAMGSAEQLAKCQELAKN